MPVPFHDTDTLEELGSAGYLTIERTANNATAIGALFVVNARGEPLEFAYNRVSVPSSTLWRPADLRRFTEKRLTASLLSVCSHQPRILLCRTDEAGTTLFTRDLQVGIPVARVGTEPAPTRRVDPHTGEIVEEPPPSHVYWHPAPPSEGSAEERLFAHLSTHGLLHEPFERARVGLQEVFGPGRDSPP